MASTARLHLAAATAAVTNRFVTSVAMANGTYTLANTTMPTEGGRLITATITGVTGNDTPGTITVVGTDLSGMPQTEVITLVAGGSTTGARVFKTVASITQAGWIITGGNDTIVIGCSAVPFASSTSGGYLGAVIVNTTAAGTVTIADGLGTIAVLKTSIAEGVYRFEVQYSGALSVALTAASDVTVVFTPFSS